MVENLNKVTVTPFKTSKTQKQFEYLEWMCVAKTWVSNHFIST